MFLKQILNYFDYNSYLLVLLGEKRKYCKKKKILMNIYNYFKNKEEIFILGN